MVRKPKDDAETLPPVAGSNTTDETKRHYYKQALKAQQVVEEAQEVLKGAKDVLNNVLKVAGENGVNKAAIKFALKARLLDKDELVHEQREIARMLALSGIWPSIQTDFFADLKPPVDLTAETTADVAYDNGHTCGVKGENRTLNPHVPATEQYDAWDRGWLTGQGANVEKLVPAATRKGRKGKETEPATDVPAAEIVEPLFE